MKKKIKFKKINFSSGEFEEIYNKVKNGGLVVAPAASALVEIENDKIYHRSQINSDVALLDSGFFCILLRIFKNQKVKKLSGYKFLKQFINLRLNKFKKIHTYIAPFYKSNKYFS